MKLIIVFAVFCAVALAAPVHDVVNVAQKSDVGPEDFTFYSTNSDGNTHSAEGKLKDVGTDHEALVVQGSYAWIDEKTGEQFTVTYVADENGFRPSGAHLPVA